MVGLSATTLEPQEKKFVKFVDDLFGILRSTVQDHPKVTVLQELRSIFQDHSKLSNEVAHRSSSTNHNKWARLREAELQPLPHVEARLQLTTRT